MRTAPRWRSCSQHVALTSIVLVLRLIELHGPGGQFVEINPEEIVSLREPRAGDHFAFGIKCLIFTSDGKYTGVIETCAQVAEMVKADRLLTR